MKDLTYTLKHDNPRFCHLIPLKLRSVYVRNLVKYVMCINRQKTRIFFRQKLSENDFSLHKSPLKSWLLLHGHVAITYFSFSFMTKPLSLSLPYPSPPTFTHKKIHLLSVKRHEPMAKLRWWWWWRWRSYFDNILALHWLPFCLCQIPSFHIRLFFLIHSK